jgi:hypothetical protein
VAAALSVVLSLSKGLPSGRKVRRRAIRKPKGRLRRGSRLSDTGEGKRPLESRRRAFLPRIRLRARDGPSTRSQDRRRRVTCAAMLFVRSTTST